MATVSVSITGKELTPFQHELLTNIFTSAIYTILAHYLFRKKKSFAINIEVINSEYKK